MWHTRAIVNSKMTYRKDSSIWVVSTSYFSPSFAGVSLPVSCGVFFFQAGFGGSLFQGQIGGRSVISKTPWVLHLSRPRERFVCICHGYGRGDHIPRGTSKLWRHWGWWNLCGQQDDRLHLCSSRLSHVALSLHHIVYYYHNSMHVWSSQHLFIYYHHQIIIVTAYMVLTCKST